MRKYLLLLFIGLLTWQTSFALFNKHFDIKCWIPYKTNSGAVKYKYAGTLTHFKMTKKYGSWRPNFCLRGDDYPAANESNCAYNNACNANIAACNNSYKHDKVAPQCNAKGTCECGCLATVKSLQSNQTYTHDEVTPDQPCNIYR